MTKIKVWWDDGTSNDYDTLKDAEEAILNNAGITGVDSVHEYDPATDNEGKYYGCEWSVKLVLL